MHVVSWCIIFVLSFMEISQTIFKLLDGHETWRTDRCAESGGNNMSPHPVGRRLKWNLKSFYDVGYTKKHMIWTWLQYVSASSIDLPATNRKHSHYIHPRLPFARTLRAYVTCFFRFNWSNIGRKSVRENRPGTLRPIKITFSTPATREPDDNRSPQIASRASVC